jgi:hypothetical protein
VALAVCAIGFLVVDLLTIEAFTTGVTLACPEGETINCAKVTESEWSKLFGIPVAPLGLAFFAGMAWLSAVDVPAPRRPLGSGLAGVGVGLAMVLYLVWAVVQDPRDLPVVHGRSRGDLRASSRCCSARSSSNRHRHGFATRTALAERGDRLSGRLADCD